MNRPFYAFGLLLALLALAMFAVSSTGRTTTVQTSPDGAAGTLLAPAPSRGTLYVLVLPASEDTLPAAGETEQPRSASALQPCRIVPLPLTRPMAPASVQVAATIPNCECSAADCRSHHDAAYDDAVYGNRNVPPRADSECRLQDLGPSGLSSQAEEDWAVFESFLPLGGAARVRTSPSLPTSLWRNGWQRLQSLIPSNPSVWRGVRNWALRPLERSLSRSATGPGVSWSDYAQFFDELSRERSLAREATKAPTADATVRSSGWLLHFAVSSLSRVGLILQQTAADLQRLENRLDTAASPPASESPSE